MRKTFIAIIALSAFMSYGAHAWGGKGVGIGLGIGEGGDASARATSRNTNTNTNRNRTDVHTSTRQGQGQLQGQMQGNIGLGSGNDTSVTVEGDEVVYEAPKKPDVPAYAPDAIASPATAPCYATWSVSAGWAAMFAGGASGYVKDHGCAFGEVARRASDVGNQSVAEEALAYMLDIVKREAGVEGDNDVDGAVAAHLDVPRHSVVVTQAGPADTSPSYIPGGPSEAFAWQHAYE